MLGDIRSYCSLSHGGVKKGVRANGRMYDSLERTTRPHGHNTKQHTDKGWRSDLMPSWASGHDRGSQEDIHSTRIPPWRRGCGWPSSHSTGTRRNKNAK